MMQSLHEMWVARSPRERVMLGGLGIVLLVLGYVCLALFPSMHFRDRAIERLTMVQQTGTQIRQLVSSLSRSVPAATNGQNEALNVRLARSAAAAALQLARYEPEADGGAAITIENVQSAAALQWLAMLERNDGLKIRRLTMEPSSTGLVTLQASLIERKS